MPDFAELRFRVAVNRSVVPATLNRNMSDLRNALGILKKALQAPTRRVIAVIGPEALTVEARQPDGSVREVSFYRLVAEKLLLDRDLPTDLLDAPGPMWLLHRATSILMERQGCTTDALRPMVEDVIHELQSQCSPDPASPIRPSGALLELAQIDCFRLILSLTPDDLLPQALHAAQPGLALDMAGYSPNLDLESGWPMDVPAYAKDRQRHFQLLGRIGNVGDFAVHEEDALEHLQRFHDDAERGAKTLLTDLRNNRNNVLVYLGCGLPDWMGRGLLRMLSEQRFISGERPYDFFCAGSPDGMLTGFLDQFSKKSVVLPWSAREFAQEIRSMSQAAVPAAPWQPGRPPAMAGAASSAATGQAPSVFISYASENAPAAMRVADQLRTLGFGDIWLDSCKLLTGDDWSDRIDDAIATCDYFVPLLSAEADRRDEGVYWEEWRKAMARALRKFDAFLLPIGIDANPPAKDGYTRIFSGWTRPLNDLHLLHAPGGEMNPDTRGQLARRIQQPSGGRP